MSAALIAEIGADTRGFEAGLNRADAAADRFSHKVAKKLDKAFGVGFLAGFVTHIPGKLMEHAEKIAEGAKKLHVTAEQYQLVDSAASAAGQSVEEFTAAIEKSGGSLFRTLPKLEKYRDKIQMTNQDVKDWTDIGWGAKQFALGAMKPVMSALRVGFYAAKGMAALTGAATGLGAEAPTTDILLRWQGLQDENGDSTALSVPEDLKRNSKMRQYKGLLDLLSKRSRKYERSREGLEDESTRIHREQQQSQGGHLWSPDYTDWQQAGAYKQTPNMVVGAADQTNQRLEVIADEARSLQREMERNREMVQEVRDEVQKLRTGDGG